MKVTVFAVVLLLSMAGACMCADTPSFHGIYVNKQDSKEYLSLDPNGTFVLKQRKVPPEITNPFAEVTGKYRKVNDDVILMLSNGGEATGTLKGNSFQDSQGTVWVKQGTETYDLKRAKRLKW